HLYCSIKNSAKDLVFPKIDKKLPTYLSEKEVYAILMYAQQDTSLLGNRNTIILYLLYVSGMRVSELINLSLADFHFDTGFVCVNGKGGKQRMIPIPISILSLVTIYVESLKVNFKKVSTKESL